MKCHWIFSRRQLGWDSTWDQLYDYPMWYACVLSYDSNLFNNVGFTTPSCSC